MKRLVIVYNRNSSKSKHVEAEVLSKLPSDHTEFVVDNTKNVDGNAADLAKFVLPGDRIIAAGGDGTATICVNAILNSGIEDISFGIIPFGNFNDMARTFGFMNVSDMIKPDVATVSAYPLELLVDGEHFRYGMCYFTLGMFAESTKIFDQDKIRKQLRRRRCTRPRAFVFLANWYVKHRHDAFLPKMFKLNGCAIKNATDYVAVNSATMASMMRNRKRSFTKQTFVSKTGNLGRWRGLIGIMVPSVIWQIPGHSTKRDLLEFESQVDLEVQAEGEYFTLQQVSTLEVRKPTRTVNIITNRP